jgi:hypothetical protein
MAICIGNAQLWCKTVRLHWLKFRRVVYYIWLNMEVSNLKLSLSLINNTSKTYMGEWIYICVIYICQNIKIQLYPLNRRMDVPQMWFRGFGEENSSMLPGTEPLVLSYPARSLVSITAKLSRLTFESEFRPRQFCEGFVIDKFSLICFFWKCSFYCYHNQHINAS